MKICNKEGKENEKSEREDVNNKKREKINYICKEDIYIKKKVLKRVSNI